MSEHDRNIVSMVERCRERRLAPIQALESYWISLLKDGVLPLRSEIEPRAIEDLLEYAFIGEKVTDRLAKLRVAGSHLSDLSGMAVSGMPLATLFTQTARPHLAKATDKLFNTPAVIRLDLIAKPSVWADKMTGQMILCPLQSDLGDTTRALGAMITDGQIGGKPRKFDITKITIKPIQVGSDIRADEPPAPASIKPRRANIEQRRTSAPRRDRPLPDLRADQGLRDNAHLRLVVCND